MLFTDMDAACKADLVKFEGFFTIVSLPHSFIGYDDIAGTGKEI